MTTVTATEELRAWLRSAIEGEAEIRLPSLTDSALSWLGHKKQEALREELTEQLLRSSVYEEAKRVVRNTRTLSSNGDAKLTEKQFTKKSERFANRFLSWYEHVGDRHIRLMSADREQLLTAAALRDGRGEHELRLATLFRRMAAGLEGGQTVEERFTAEEIEALY